MGKRTVFFLWMTLLLWGTAMAAPKRYTLVIDAGHGGADSGAKGTFALEKNINLNVALAFGRLVERNCPDVNVVYTRKTDVFVPLHKRASIANRHKADLFISIHTNALPKGKRSRGMETYTLGMHRADDNFDVAKRENSVILIEQDYRQHYEGFDPNSSESYIMFELLQDNNMAQSVELARLVQKKTCLAAGRSDKGVKQAGFLVLRETSMPGCLIELGFITTPDEERYLSSKEGVEALGRGIYNAFIAYKSKYGGAPTVPYREAPVEQPAPPAPKDIKQKVTETTEQRAEKAEATIQPEVKAEKKRVENEDDRPVFKVQILTSQRSLRPGSQQFKGEKEVDFYHDAGLYKYTCGATADFSEASRLRKQLLAKFPEAFIVAFKNGMRMDINEAITEYKKKKK
ncbi:MAG: N-acetylmuramoyl-L-alanine amidase [Prevotella sp.]